MKQFQNDNGNTYTILKQFGDDKHNYTLVSNQTYEQYIVAHNLNTDENYWEQGDYFQQLKQAQQHFEQKVFNKVISQFAEVSKQHIKAAAYDNLIRENGEAVASIERTDFFDELYYQTKQACDYDLDQYEKQFQYFCDQLANEAFLDIMESDTGVEIIVGYDYLFDRDINHELCEIPEIVNQQLNSVSKAAEWLRYYQSYDLAKIPQAILTTLQAPVVVEQCVAKIVCAKENEILAVQKQFPNVPVQEIHIACRAEYDQTAKISDEYQHFFNYLQRFIWEKNSGIAYPYLEKLTVNLVKQDPNNIAMNWEELQQFCGIGKSQILAKIQQR